MRGAEPDQISRAAEDTLEDVVDMLEMVIEVEAFLDPLGRQALRYFCVGLKLRR